LVKPGKEIKTCPTNNAKRSAKNKTGGAGATKKNARGKGRGADQGAIKSKRVGGKIGEIR